MSSRAFAFLVHPLFDPKSVGGGMQAPSLSESPLSPLEMRPSVESLRSADSASPTATSVEPSQASKQALQKTSLTSIPEVGSPPYLSVEENMHSWHKQQGKVYFPLEASTCYGRANGYTATQNCMPNIICWIAQSHVPKAEPSIEPVVSFTPPGKRSLASPFGAAVTEDEQGMSPPSAAQGDAIRGNDSQANSR